MKFKPAVWFPISTILAVINAGAIWFAARDAEPTHATVHGVLAIAFTLWAERLHRRRASGGAVLADQVGGLELDMEQMRQELAEAQERLDFAERMLAQEKRQDLR